MDWDHVEYAAAHPSLLDALSECAQFNPLRCNMSVEESTERLRRHLAGFTAPEGKAYFLSENKVSNRHTDLIVIIQTDLVVLCNLSLHSCL